MKVVDFVLVLCVMVVGVANGVSGTTGPAERRFMPWMCLSRCNASQADIQANLRSVIEMSPIVWAVSYEHYNLGPKSTLVLNNLTDIGPHLHEAGIRRYPMISSYPYPPQFLSWMREVFTNPEPFVQALVDETRKYGYEGYNVDWEPTTAATPADALAYAAFLSKLSTALHAEGAMLTVDVGSWSAVWNFTALAASGVDRVIDMSTYTGNAALWTQALEKGVTHIGVSKLGVGLETINTATKKPYTDAELKQRFAAIKAAGVQEVDVWKMPISSLWLPHLYDFVFPGGPASHEGDRMKNNF